MTCKYKALVNVVWSVAMKLKVSRKQQANLKYTQFIKFN